MTGNGQYTVHCREEGCAYFCRAVDLPYHMRTHNIPRPGDDWLSLQEVATALGKPKETVRSWVRFNSLEVLVKKGSQYRPQVWIHRKVLTKFLKDNFLSDVDKVIEWAEKGQVPRG